MFYITVFYKADSYFISFYNHLVAVFLRHVSDLVIIKTKSRNRLDVRSDVRLAVSNTESNIKSLVRRGQDQVSH